jgi:transketolase
MEQYDKIVLLTADEHSPELTILRETFPRRCFSFGIAECNMVGAAAGFSRAGFLPVVYTVASFLAYRTFEAIRCDICMNNFNVILAGYACGVKINNFGPVHHALEDIAVLRSLPELVLLSPASVNEVAPVTKAALEIDSPVYIRIGKAFETEIFNSPPSFTIGKSEFIREGCDLTIIGTGNIIANAMDAADLLEKEYGLSADIINMSTLKPIDKEAILSSARKTHRVVTVEEHQVIGGLGGAVSEVLAQSGVNAKLEIIGFNDTFCTAFGWHRDLLEAYGLSAKHIFERIKAFMEK